MKTNASQRGATLVVALIFLVLMSLFAISAFNSSSNNLRIVGNSQAMQESLSAAQLAVEATISTPEFYQNPNGVATSPIPVDMNGDGTADYTAWLKPAPQCYRAKPLLKEEIPDPPKDGETTVDVWEKCRYSLSQTPISIDKETPDTSTNPASCAAMEWNVRAEVKDATSSTQVTVNQGVAVINQAIIASNYCN